MDRQLQVPLIADPFFDHTLVIGQAPTLPGEFPKENLPDYLPDRHQEIRKRWLQAWGPTMKHGFGVPTGLLIPKATFALVQRLRDWAIATDQWGKPAVGRRFAETAATIQQELANTESLSDSLSKILIKQWGKARYYRFPQYVDLCYLETMGSMADKANEVVIRLLETIRWKERFTEALCDEAEALGLAVNLYPVTPWPMVRQESTDLDHMGASDNPSLNHSEPQLALTL